MELTKEQHDAALIEAYLAFKANPCAENAYVLMDSAAYQVEMGGDAPVAPDGEQLWNHRLLKLTEPYRVEDLKKPDNPADVTIVVEISGNRLVRILNTFDSMLHQRKRSGEWHDGRRDIKRDVETLRDILSSQRMAKSKV